MKFSAQVAVAFLSAGALANIAPRALSNFQVVLATVQTDVDNLDTAVNAFTGGSTTAVQAASTTLINDLISGNTALIGQPVLSLADTLALNANVNTFKTHAQTLVTDLKAKRPTVISSGNCALVRTNINNINTASNTLVQTIVSKAAAAAQSIAQGQATAIQAILDDARAYYTVANCP